MAGNDETEKVYSDDKFEYILPDGTIAPQRPQEVQCKKCGKTFHHELNYMQRMWFEKNKVFDFIPNCEECCQQEETERKEQAAAAREAKWVKQWEDICPPLYLRTDASRLPKKGMEAITEWEYNDDGMGLGFVGPPGKCKTRLVFELGRRIHMDHKEVKAVSATHFARLCSGQFMGSDDRKDACERAFGALAESDYLIFDDIGKQKFTERVEMEFFGMLEYRTSNLLTTFWTANAGSKELASMMSPDRSEAIIRRLSEFSTIVQL